jgi:hypothetical protein
VTHEGIDMSVIDDINAHRYLYLTHLEEPEDNVLRLIVTEGRVDTTSKPEGMEGLGRLATDSRPIVADELCAAYEVRFEQYIAYAVLNESFTVRDDAEKFEGKLFRTYSESKFLTYVRTATIASDDYPGPFTHYGIVCLNHIIDVTSSDAPRITLVHPPTAQRP